MYRRLGVSRGLRRLMAIVGSHNTFAPFQDKIVAESLANCHGQPFGHTDNSRIAHLHGKIALRLGRADLAIASLASAVLLNPSDSRPYLDLVDALIRMGRYANALAASLRAVVLSPDCRDCLICLARTLGLAGRTAEACGVLQRAVLAQSNDTALHVALGNVRQAAGRSSQAIESFTTASVLAPHDPDIRLRLGRAYLGCGDWQQALAAFSHGLDSSPDRADLQAGVAEALFRLGRIGEAERALRTALNIEPFNVEFHRQLVLVLEVLGHRGDAAEAWFCLGRALARAGRLPEAAAAFRRTIALRPQSVRTLLSLGRIDLMSGHIDDAIRSFESATAIDAQHIDAHVALGRARQIAGQIARSWNELVWHHHPYRKDSRRFHEPMWDGSVLDGRTILLWADRDMAPSDVILYLRYAQLVHSRGGRLLVQCHRALFPLVELMPEVEQTIAPDGPLATFDVQAPLMYLPALVRVARTSIPASTPSEAAYLEAPHCDYSWTTSDPSCDTRFIGIAWQSDILDEAKVSLPVRTLISRTRTTRTRFISLQRGVDVRQVMVDRRDGARLEQVLPGHGSLSDVASVMARLDLVIAVDSVIAHLAGALGRPVWTFLSSNHRWPWPASGVSTVWYPTMRLYRQAVNGDWNHALDAACTTITEDDGHRVSGTCREEG